MDAKTAWLVILFISAFFSLGFEEVEAGENIMENNVAVITRSNLVDLVNGNRILLIMCYVPWDSEYQEKIKDYEQVAQVVFRTTKDVTLAKLDVAADVGAAVALEVYPENGLQFIFYRKGVSYNFADFTDIKALTNKIKTISDPDWTPPEVPVLINRVKEIQKKDFVNDLITKAFSVVLFYKPSSLASMRLLYDFEMAVSSLKVSNGMKQTFHRFDAEDKWETMAKYNVTRLPAFKIFRYGKAYDYNGPLVNPTEIKKYIATHMEQPLTTIADPAELEVFMKKNADRATVVGFFASITLSSFPNFVEAAQALRDRFSFALMSTPMVSNGDGEEPKQAPGWTLAVFLPKRQHTPDDEKKSVLQYEEASYEMILDFIKWKGTPLAGERTRRNADTVYGLRPLVVVYSRVDWKQANRKDTEFLRDKVASAAKDHKDTLFAFSDSIVFKDEVERFGFDTDSKYDLHVGIIGKDGEYYPRWDTAHMSAKMISEFVKQYKDGEIKPFYRSKTSELAKNSVAGTGLKELTGETFKTEILQGPSDALVLLYHPLAKYWRLVQSFLKDLAKDVEFKKQNVVFAEMDVSTNDAPAFFQLPTFPLIYFSPKNDRQNPLRMLADCSDEHAIRQFLKDQLEKSSPKEILEPGEVPKTKPAKTEL